MGFITRKSFNSPAARIKCLARFNLPPHNNRSRDNLLMASGVFFFASAGHRHMYQARQQYPSTGARRCLIPKRVGTVYASARQRPSPGETLANYVGFATNNRLPHPGGSDNKAPHRRKDRSALSSSSRRRWATAAGTVRRAQYPDLAPRACPVALAARSR